MTINLFNTTNFLQTAGYLGLFLIMFAETGLLIGLVLPGGDSMLFTAGFLSSLGYFNIWAVISLTFVAVVLADSLEYFLGKKYGNRIFYKERSLLFDKEYIKKSEDFYNRHGGKTILIARFIPFVRTLAPMFAGIGKMRYSLFVTYNIIGALIWTLSINLLGYYLGKTIPNADHYVLLLILLVVAASIISPLLGIFGHKQRRKRFFEFFKERV